MAMLRALVAVLIFCVFGEVLARATHLVDRLNGYGRALYTAGPNPELPYRLRPGLETTYVGAPVRVNRFGFRGADTTADPAPGVRRILFAGDSVVFGQGVREEETVAVVTARALNGTGPVTTETVNVAAPGYDTLAEVRLLESAGLAMHPDAVVLGMSLNDYDPPPSYSPIGVLSTGDATGIALVDHSEFAMLLRWLWRYLHGTLGFQVLARIERDLPGAPATAGLDRIVEAAHRRFYEAPPAAGWARVTHGFDALADLVRTHRTDVLVAIFPERYQVEEPSPDLTAQRKLLELCAARRLRCLDLQPAFAAAGGTLFLDAQHPNAAGHAVAGKAIATALSAP